MRGTLVGAALAVGGIVLVAILLIGKPAPPGPEGYWMPCLDTMQTLAGRQIQGDGGEVAAETRGDDIYIPVDVDEANEACNQAARKRLLWGAIAGVAAALLTFGIGRMVLDTREDQP